jgi:hypothetical protein
MAPPDWVQKSGHCRRILFIVVTPHEVRTAAPRPVRAGAAGPAQVQPAR